MTADEAYIAYRQGLITRVEWGNILIEEFNGTR